MAMAANFVLFQVGWLACVLGGAWQMPWLGTLVAAVIIAWHLHVAARPRFEVQLILLAGALGAAWDSALVSAGLLSYPSGTLIAGTAPHWIIAMWMLFATTLNLSLRWLQGRYWLSAVCGALAGPLAYYAGMRLGGVYMPDMQGALLALSLGWAVLLPLLTWLAPRFDGTCAEPAGGHVMAGR